MLSDLKVIELASVLAGPGVGQFLAELGADVIKIENPRTGGDVTRSWRIPGEAGDDRSAYFCSVNWGKRSVALDLTTTRDREICYKLVRTADVVIASFKPGDAEKLGMDYKTLSNLRADLIYGQITGYGSDNKRTGYDAVIQAEAGFMSMNGEPGGASLKMPVALIDVLAGHHLKEAILLAIIERIKTGKGKFIDIPLIYAGVVSLVNQATNWLMAGYLPKKEGSAHPNIAPYGDVFTTLDGCELMLAVGNDRQFSDLCTLLNLDDLAGNALYANNAARVVNRESLRLILHAEIVKQKADSLVSALHERHIPAGLIRSVADVLQDEQVRELILHQGSAFGLKSYLGPARERKLLPPPHLGEHTESILSGL
ncbi:MAG TPA: CaiB/BaiF CoA-transferase family protein [Ohtaekwangia sp.]|nr:CaiB/BaiF CoA-transferase family protein [Ohtaekwangia sp.]